MHPHFRYVGASAWALTLLNESNVQTQSIQPLKIISITVSGETKVKGRILVNINAVYKYTLLEICEEKENQPGI